MKRTPQSQDQRQKRHEQPNPRRQDVAASVQAARREEGLPAAEPRPMATPTPIDKLRKKMELNKNAGVKARVKQLVSEGHPADEALVIARGEILAAAEFSPGTAEFAAQYLSPETQPARLEYRFRGPAGTKRRPR